MLQGTDFIITILLRLFSQVKRKWKKLPWMGRRIACCLLKNGMKRTTFSQLFWTKMSNLWRINFSNGWHLLWQMVNFMSIIPTNGVVYSFAVWCAAKTAVWMAFQRLFWCGRHLPYPLPRQLIRQMLSTHKTGVKCPQTPAAANPEPACEVRFVSK